jgi:hypothetical protein
MAAAVEGSPRAVPVVVSTVRGAVHRMCGHRFEPSVIGVGRAYGFRGQLPVPGALHRTGRGRHPYNQQEPGQRVERKVVLVDPMRRRTLVKWSLGATAVTGLGIGSAAKVGAADVARLQRDDARLNRLTDQHGGETLWQVAAAGHLR